MIFKIILAEDEPAAQRHLNSIIKKKCLGFEVVGIAEDGFQAFEMVEKMNPDLLISDIRMPRMDGMDLVARVKDFQPEIYSIIISGYQEFQYAKKAIKSDVIDYLLKPINIPALVSLLEKVHRKLSLRKYDDIRRDLILQLSGQITSGTKPAGKLLMAVIRRNGLHSRFTQAIGNKPSKEMIDKFIGVLLPKEKESVWLFEGRDDNEWCLVAQAEKLHYSRFQELVKKLSISLPSSSFYNAVLAISFPVNKTNLHLTKLYQILREQSILGESRIFFEDSPSTSEGLKITSLDSLFFKKLDFVCQNGKADILNQDLKSHFHIWQKDRLPMLKLLIELRHIITHVLQYCPDKCDIEISLEVELDTAVMDSLNYNDLFDRFIIIFKTALSHIESLTPKMGSRESLERITSYISTHIGDELSVPFLCRTFSISQSYLNKIFHKYMDQSVTEFIRILRIEKSIILMKESSEILLKDLSLMVGYEDASYFSKVFKATKGISPLQYRELRL